MTDEWWAMHETRVIVSEHLPVLFYSDVSARIIITIMVGDLDLIVWITTSTALWSS